MGNRKTPLYRGMAECYRQYVKPEIPFLETLRQDALRRFLSLMIPATLALIGAYYLAQFVFAPDILLIFNSFAQDIGWGIWFTVGSYLIYKYQGEVRRKFEDTVFAAAQKEYGEMDYMLQPQHGFNLVTFIEDGILPPQTSNFQMIELLEGLYRDTPFQAARGVASEIRQNGHAVVCDGTFFRFALPFDIEGEVRILPKTRTIGGGAIKGKLFNRDGFQAVYDESGPFAEAYTVYARRPEDAERILDDRMKENILALKNSHGDKPFAMSVRDNEFFMVSPVKFALMKTSGAFNIMRLFTPVKKTIGKDAKKLLGGLTVPHRIIDHLHGDRPGPIDLRKPLKKKGDRSA